MLCAKGEVSMLASRRTGPPGTIQEDALQAGSITVMRGYDMSTVGGHACCAAYGASAWKYGST